MALEFKIELSGNFAGALEKNAAAADHAGEATKKHKHELEAFETELGKVRAGALEINFNALKEGGSFFQFDLAEGAKIAYEAIEKVVDKVLELGAEMVKVAGAAEDLNLAVKLDVGEEGLEKVNELTESFKDTRFSPAALKKALLPILEESGDEHSDQWADLVTAATDVATRRNTGAAGAATALEALRGIEIMPQKVRGALKELGIKQKDFYSDLGDLLGISAQAAEKQVKAGEIKAQTLLSVALHQIAEREGGALGGATNEGAKTLGSSIERLANVKDQLFEKLAGSEGMKALQGAVDTFVDTIEGPVGTDLMNSIDDAFKTLFGDLSGPDGAKKIQAVIEDVAGDVKSMVESFQQAWPDIKAGAADVWEVLKGIGETVGLIVKGWAEIARLSRDADSGKLQQDVGEAVLGVHAEATGNTPKNYHYDEATNRYIPGAPEVSDDIPAFAEGGYVDRPTLAIVGEAGPEWIVPEKRRSAFADMAQSEGPAAGRTGSGDVMQSGGRSGGGDINYSPTYQVTGGDVGAVREQLEQFDRQARVEFKKIIDELRAA